MIENFPSNFHFLKLRCFKDEREKRLLQGLSSDDGRFCNFEVGRRRKSRRENTIGQNDKMNEFRSPKYSYKVHFVFDLSMYKKNL